MASTPSSCCCLLSSLLLLLLLFCGGPPPVACMSSSSGSSKGGGATWREEAMSRASGRAVAVDDFDTVPVSARRSGLRVLPVLRGTIPSTGTHYVAHACVVFDPAAAFSVEAPLPHSCGVRRRTSSTARSRGCSYATNGGFFDMGSGQCLGSTVSNGHHVRQVSGEGGDYVSLGLVLQEQGAGPASSPSSNASSSSYWVVGSVTPSTLQGLRPHQLIQGLGWLVRAGRPYVRQSMGPEGGNSSFATEKAPRTAAGLLSNGSLLLLQVDGQEDVSYGLDLMEMAELLLLLKEEEGEGGGVWQAVNLDGGGSSVTWRDGHVTSRPTCLDNSIVCQRRVTTIMCIRQPHQQHPRTGTRPEEPPSAEDDDDEEEDEEQEAEEPVAASR